MPVSKKERTTSEAALSKSEPSSHPLPEQQEFHQHLRALAQSAVRTVLELVMREELDTFIGAAWGECSPQRKGYRNGTYTRDLATSTGRLEEIKVPRDRAGQFHTQAFERYSRYEPHIAEGLTQMFVAGTSTHKVGEVAQTLLGVAPSASTISRLNQSLTQQFDTWRQRSLQEHWRVLYLDGVHFSIRHGDKVDSTIILTALGVDLAGNKEVLALRACAEESKEGWLSLLQDLRTRGATAWPEGTSLHEAEIGTTMTVRPTRLRQTLRFLLHFVEMVLAMMVGMGVFAVVNSAILIPMGFVYLSASVFPQAYALAMAVAMTVAMVAWMFIRKHAWRLSAEMAGAMIVPTVLLIAICSIGHLPSTVLLTGTHILMLPAMLAVMLYRWRDYAGH